MKICLFCENRYAVDILSPLQDEALGEGGHEVLWYAGPQCMAGLKGTQSAVTGSMAQVRAFRPDAVFVPGNIVPYWLSGVKVGIFHGYAVKRDQFVIRRYFDLYCTQGPFYTSRFEALARQYGDFEVRETGWTKQDWVQRHLHDYDAQKAALLQKYGKQRVVIYAPTFSPKLTSLPCMKPALERLLAERDVVLLLKFHPLTRQEWCDEYRAWAQTQQGAVYIDAGENVTSYQMMSDLMISDTSSAIYEFLLLGRPVVTLNTIERDIHWENIADPSDLTAAFDRVWTDPESIARREWITANIDPYTDGQCCRRMLDAARDYISRHGVPAQRRLNLWRKYKCIKTFGWPK